MIPGEAIILALFLLYAVTTNRKGATMNDSRIKVGQTYRDEAHGDTFTITGIESDSVDLDNGQWYELAGPDGLIAKLNSGVVKEVVQSE